VRDLGLLDVKYSTFTAYGHFGRQLPGMNWERLDRVDELRVAADA